MDKLNDKVALVTGGSAGLGKATALLFANEGAKIGITARREDEGRRVVEEIRAAGGEAIFIRADVRNASDCANAVEQTVRAFGKLDIALNNAGVETYGNKVADTEEAEWDRVLDTNLKGVFLSMKYQIPEMLKAGGGCIINMASMYGLVGTAFGGSPYHASKNGVIGLTRSAALEFAKQNIRVNALCPGVIATEMVERWFSDTGLGDQVRAMHPIGRVGTPAEAAAAALFLAGAESSFMTGATLSIDGGYTAG
jgi:NAD(P)-dependent dehydrogenase (short-subunit alcohol dehydrogenase family)